MKTSRLAVLGWWCALLLTLWSWTGASSVIHAATTSVPGWSPSDFKQWGLLAVQDNGRRKPLDTFARESLLKLSGRSAWTDTAGRRWSANEFLLSMLAGEDRDWNQEPLILVNYHPLAQHLGLDPERRRFSFAQLAGSPELRRLAAEVQQSQPTRRNIDGSEAPPDPLTREVLAVSERVTLFNALHQGTLPLLAPPRPDARVGEAWLSLPAAMQSLGDAGFGPVREPFSNLVNAYRSGNAYGLNVAAVALRGSLRTLGPAVYPEESVLAREAFYNGLGAFGKAGGLYALGLVLLGVGSLVSNGLGRTLRGAGILVGLGGFLFQSIGLALRCVIAGRPPVTNMFESVIWVSFVVALLGFAFFAYHRAPTYLLAALPVSALSLLLVLNAPAAMPASIDPLRAVLRDNFWLTTHVLTITASYGAFALAMAFAHVTLFRYLVNPAAAEADGALHRWLYSVIGLGVLLITVGTVLGAFWANYSWGRYWGWDPKETWALITLLCYIVVLHGRLAGLWGNFGLAVGSVLCFSAVVMAWYGVNFWLGKGLHSYGFGVGGGRYVAATLALDGIFLGAVCWRRLQWRQRSPRPRQQQGDEQAPVRSESVAA